MQKFALFLFLITNWIRLSGQGTAELPAAGPIRLTDSVSCTPVQDQAQSPTCWVFGTNALFESDLIKLYNIRLNLSEMFIARHAYIDKANRFLATGGKTYFEGGGQFHDVIRVIRNHGMVPEEVYSGLTNGRFMHNHDKLDTAMQRFIRPMLAQGKTALDSLSLQQVKDTLDKYLGRVPPVFLFNGKTYTPRTFADEVLKTGNDYVELVSFADKPLYKQFVLEDKYNWASDSFYNITLDEMMMLVDTALQKGWSVGWEGDVTEPGFNYFGGYAALPDEARRYDDERLANYRDETTERDHMVQVAGIGRDRDNKKWYYMKNSWGTFFSRYKGYFFMDENYFKLKTVILFVHRQALPQALKEKLGLF